MKRLLTFLGLISMVLLITNLAFTEDSPSINEYDSTTMNQIDSNNTNSEPVLSNAQINAIINSVSNYNSDQYNGDQYSSDQYSSD